MINIDLTSLTFGETLSRNPVLTGFLIALIITAVTGFVFAFYGERIFSEYARKHPEKEVGASGIYFFGLAVVIGIFASLGLTSNPLDYEDTRNDLRTKIADTYGVELSDEDIYTLEDGVRLRNSDGVTGNPNSYVDSEKTVSVLSNDYTTTREYKLRFIGTDKVQLLERTGDVADGGFTPAKPLSK